MSTVPRRAHSAPDTSAGLPSEHLEHVADRISAYRPNGVNQASWLIVAPHVRAAVTAYAPDTVSSAYLALQACTRFAIWAHEGNLPLDPERLYTESTVEHFAAIALKRLDSHTRASYRSVLRRVGRKITRKAEWSPQPPRLERRALSEPYTDEDIAWLWEVARHQVSSTRMRAARSLMCLAYGAGLRAPEYSTVTAADIRWLDGIPVVTVRGGPPRSVPVLPEAHDDLRWLIDSVPAEEELFARWRHVRNYTAAVIAHIEVPARAPRFVSRRLRITWMTRLGAAGLRISELGYLAGVTTTSAWEELGRYIPKRDDDLMRALIGGIR